jgi:hypothetical protein
MKRQSFASLLVAVVILSLAVFAQASNPQTPAAVSVPASMSINESLSLVVTGGPLVIPATQNTASNALTATATYNLVAANHAGGIQYVTYFSATNALTGNFTVTSSQLSTQVNGGTWLACSGTSVQGSVAGATCTAWTSVPQSQLTTTPSGTKNDTIAVEYTGTTLTNAGSASGTFNVLVYSL